MRYTLLLLWLLGLVSQPARAQELRDPTVPRASLKPTTVALAADGMPVMPELRLKAMVMQDRDHASAVVATVDRRLLIKLNRDAPVQFTIKGVQFEVLDFDAKSIRVKCSLGEQVIN